MIPLCIFLLACTAAYLGTIGSAFSALMRLSLRLVAERSDRPDALAAYLDDPVLLFAPVRLLLGIVTACATALLGYTIGIGGISRLALTGVAGATFVAVFELLLPILIVSRDPERVLELVLPSFGPISRMFAPLTQWTTRLVASTKRQTAGGVDDTSDRAGDAKQAFLDGDAQESIIAGEERRLLQSIVDFGDTLVREIMTPRPDIVAIRYDATIQDLLDLFREQESSRFPVFKDSLDNIAGFVFVKDLVVLGHQDETRPISTLLRPAVFVPESKRVPELLKQFQRQQTQIAVVVDEYGGTAGLVTIEDMLEEIVGEIRDEYDVETESVVEDSNGGFVFRGKVDVDEVAQRLNVPIARDGFETVGGFLLAHLGRVPAVGEQMDIDGLHVEVLEVERRRVNKVRITRRVGDEVGESERVS